MYQETKNNIFNVLGVKCYSPLSYHSRMLPKEGRKRGRKEIREGGEERETKKERKQNPEGKHWIEKHKSKQRSCQ